MSQFDFRGPDGKGITPKRWLRVWSGLYRPMDEEEYQALIAKHKRLSADDFVRIGKWKDGANAPGRWKANVAMVAYPIWMQIVLELPKSPASGQLAVFLGDWSGRTYTDKFQSGSRRKRFGLSRATTLLHFLSGGRSPIFDSRVRRALKRLTGLRIPYTVTGYLDLCCRLVAEIEQATGAGDVRTVDKALFSYGAGKLQAQD